MESPVLRLKKEKGPNLYILQRTRTIQQEDIDCSWQWDIINGWYKATEGHPDCEWVDKAVTTIINAIVHQRRLAFALGVHTTRALLKEDGNWDKAIQGLRNENYPLLIAKLCETKTIELVREGKGQELSIYKVISEDIKKMIVIDSMDQQIAEVIDFIDNKEESKRGKQKGKAKGELESKKERKIESETSEPNSTCLVEKSLGGITFEELLFKEYSGSKWPYYGEEMRDLAQYAVTNCVDFEPDNYHMSIFERHLKGRYDKLRPEQKKEMEKRVASFKIEAKEYYSLMKTKDIVLIEPKDLTSQSIKQDIDNEDKNQSYTLQVMLGSAVGDNIKVLKRSLEKTSDKQEKNQIEQEIEYWEQMNG